MNGDDLNFVELTGEITNIRTQEGVTKKGKSYKRTTFLLNVYKNSRYIKVSCGCWDEIAENMKIHVTDLDRVHIKGYINVNTWKDIKTNMIKVDQSVEITWYERCEISVNENTDEKYESVVGKIDSETEPKEMEAYNKGDLPF